MDDATRAVRGIREDEEKQNGGPLFPSDPADFDPADHEPLVIAARWEEVREKVVRALNADLGRTYSVKDYLVPKFAPRGGGNLKLVFTNTDDATQGVLREAFGLPAGCFVRSQQTAITVAFKLDAFREKYRAQNGLDMVQIASDTGQLINKSALFKNQGIESRPPDVRKQQCGVETNWVELKESGDWVFFWKSELMVAKQKDERWDVSANVFIGRAPAASRKQITEFKAFEDKVSTEGRQMFVAVIAERNPVEMAKMKVRENVEGTELLTAGEASKRAKDGAGQFVQKMFDEFRDMLIGSN